MYKRYQHHPITHQAIVRGGQLVGDEAVAGAGEFERPGGLLVHVVVEEDVLPHAEALPHPEVVEQCALLDLK